MPLSPHQTEILRTIAGHRNPESYIAGASVLQQNGLRFSKDIDIFQDKEAAVTKVALADANWLTQCGFDVEWVRREPGLHSVLVRRGSDSTRLEWVRDSDFRFFPTMKDELFGYRLHFVDIATNKALAAAGRKEPRDVLDLLHVDEEFLPLGAVIWASVAKDPGYTPEALLAEIRRNARYRDDDYADLDMVAPVNAADISRRFRDALQQAELFIQQMPYGTEGKLFLHGGKPVQPDPTKLETYAVHEGSRRGHWPSSPEIGSAMLEETGPRKP